MNENNYKSILNHIWKVNKHKEDLSRLTNLLSEDEGATRYADYYHITKIRDGAFYGRVYLKEVEFAKVVIVGNRAFEFSKIESIILNSVKVIEDYAFSYCLQLNTVQMGNNIEGVSIGKYSFAQCESLTTLECEIKELGSYAFFRCVNLESCSLKYVKKVSEGAFEDCSNLHYIYLDSAITIGDKAFYNCTSLKYLKNARYVTYIGEFSFYYCTNLEEINLPSVKTVGNEAFFHNTSLVKVDLLKVSYIGSQAFGECDSLKTFIIRSSSLCAAGYDIFLETRFHTDFYIYVPKDLIEEYKVAEHWSDYSNLFRAIEDYPDICGGA